MEDLKQNKAKKRLLFIVEEVDFYPSNVCEEKMACTES